MKCIEETCDKEIENKSGRQKFCSAVCKMRWHRKNPKSPEWKKVQTTVVYNTVLDMLSEMKDIAAEIKDVAAKKPTPITQGAYGNFAAPTPTRNFDYYKKQREECESEESWEKLKRIINADFGLSDKQKHLLTH